MLNNNNKFYLSFFIPLILAMLCNISILIYNYISTEITANEYYHYYGTSGPFSVKIVKNNGKYSYILNRLTNNFHANDWLGWNTILEPVNGIEYNKSYVLYDLDKNVVVDFGDNIIVNAINNDSTTYIYHISADLTEGDYEILRSISIYKNKKEIDYDLLPAIHFRIIAAAN